MKFFVKKKKWVPYTLSALALASCFLGPVSTAYASTGYWDPDYVGYPTSATLANVDNSYGSRIHSYSNYYLVTVSDTTSNSSYHDGKYFQAKENFYVFDGYGNKTVAHGIHTDWDTNTTTATGYHEVALQDLQSWSNLLGGNWGYVQNQANSEYATVSAGLYGSLRVISLGKMLGDFGAYKPYAYDDMCDTYYDGGKYETLGSPIVTSDPPKGSITADQSIVGAGQTESLSTTAYDDTWGNTSHRESVLITGPNGYSKWILGSADDSYWGNYDAMGWRKGGGPDVSLATTTCSASNHAPWETWHNTVNYNTSGLPAGTYTAHFYVMDWARRGSTPATASFNIDTVGLAENASWLYTNNSVQLHAHWYGAINGSYRLIIQDSNTGQYYDGGWGNPDLWINVSKGTAQQDWFHVYLQESNGTFVTQGNTVSASWNWPPDHITASPTTLTIDHDSAVTAWVQSGTLNTGQRLEIWDKTSNGVVAFGGWGSTSVSASVMQTRPTTHLYEMFITDSAGNRLSGGNATAAVSWSWPAASVQLSASPTSLPVGGKTNISSVGDNVPPGANLVIKNVTTNTVLGAYTAQDFTRSQILSEQDSKDTAQTDQYVAQVISSSGQVLAQSGPVSVTWRETPGLPSSPLNLVLHATGIPQYVNQGSSYVQKFDVSNNGTVPVSTVLQFTYQGMLAKQVQDGDIMVWQDTPVTTTTDYPVNLGPNDAIEMDVTVSAGTSYISTGLNSNGDPIWEQDPNYAIQWTANVNPARNPAETMYADNILQISVPTQAAKENQPEPVPYVISNPPGETMFGETPFYNPNWVYKNGQWVYVGPGPADWVTGKAPFNPGN